MKKTIPMFMYVFVLCTMYTQSMNCLLPMILTPVDMSILRSCDDWDVMRIWLTGACLADFYVKFRLKISK